MEAHVPPVAGLILAEALTPRTGTELLNELEGVPPDEFADLIRVLISGGFLLVT
jgi:hypothetical protein